MINIKNVERVLSAILSEKYNEDIRITVNKKTPGNQNKEVMKNGEKIQSRG